MPNIFSWRKSRTPWNKSKDPVGLTSKDSIIERKTTFVP